MRRTRTTNAQRSSVHLPIRRLLAAALAMTALAAVSLVGLGSTAHADYASTNLPDWAIGPFTRAPQNPLLTAQGTGWESANAYNPGVVKRAGVYDMLYRGQNAAGVSEIGRASSTDGTSFTRTSADPVISGTLPNEGGGLEDPRLYELNGTYYTFFTAVHAGGGGFDINEATSTDLVHWVHLGPVALNNKDAAVVTDPSDTPVKINGQYVMYYGQDGNGTYVTYSPDMIHWSSGTPVPMNFPKNYSPWEFCVAVTDYQTVQNGPINTNVVLFVAGTLMAQGRWYYGISEVEMSSSTPTQQLAELSDTALSPATPYELNGFTPNTVWMNSISFINGQWSMYYGGGDHVVALATAPLRSSSLAPLGSTSFETGQRLPDWVDQVDNGGGSSGGLANVTGFPGYGLPGPETGLRIATAHTGSVSLMYSGSAQGAAADYAYTRVLDMTAPSQTVAPSSILSYWIYPQSSATQTGVTGGNSSCAALDIVFTDGTALRNLGALDQNGSTLHPAAQCGHLTLDQWDHVESDIGAVASGKTIAHVDMGFDEPGGTGGYRGYVDDLTLGQQPIGPIVSGVSSPTMCLDDANSATSAGNPVRIWGCNGTTAQNWTLAADGTIQVLGGCLDVASSGTAPGTKVQYWPCNATGAQQWRPAAGRALVNPQSGLCLDDPSSSTTWGTQLQIYTCNGTAAQHWTLPLVG